MPLATLRTLAMIGCCLLVLSPAMRAQSGTTEERVLAALSSPGPASVAALNTIVRGSEAMPAQFLYLASGVALRENRLEDAAYLFYIARLRGAFDRELFPPVGTGGNSPMVALGALQQMYGSQINPAIMADPKTFTKVLARLKAWTPRAPTNYPPGWTFTAKGSLEKATEATAASRAQMTKSLEDQCTLLQDEAYFAAFRTIQDYNLKPGAERPSRESFDSAVATVKRIETEKGIPGAGTQLGK